MSQGSRKSQAKRNISAESSECWCQELQGLDNEEKQKFRFEREFEKLCDKLNKELDLAYKLPEVRCCPCRTAVGRDYLEETCPSESAQNLIDCSCNNERQSYYAHNQRTSVCPNCSVNYAHGPRICPCPYCPANQTHWRNEGASLNHPRYDLTQARSCGHPKTALTNHRKSKVSSTSPHNRIQTSSKCSARSPRTTEDNVVEKTLTLNMTELTNLTHLLSKGSCKNEVENDDPCALSDCGENTEAETTLMLDANTMSELLKLLNKNKKPQC